MDLVCIICGGIEKSVVGFKNSHSLMRCDFCGYMHLHPAPTEAELRDFYQDKFFDDLYNPDTCQEKQVFKDRKEQYIADKDYLFKFVQQGNILDVGCGSGGFLNTFSWNFKKYGYEINNKAASQILARNKDITMFTRLTDAPDECFDAVVLRGVIEHIPDVKETIEILVDKMVYKGVLYICATPNADSPAFLAYGAGWKLIISPDHIHYFSPRTLAMLMAKFGLTLIDIQLPYLNTTYKQPEDGNDFVSQVMEPGSENISPAYPGSMMSLVFRKIIG